MGMISNRSAITQKLLGFFFINPHDTLYVNELARRLEVDKRNLVKKLKELESDGLLKSEARGNLKLYSINRKYPLYKELRQIFLKTAGVEARLRLAVRKVAGIKAAYIFGSYARNAMQAHSDIDLLAVGDHSMVELQRELARIQRETEREVNCVHMSEEEFSRRAKDRDPFITDILAHRTIDLTPCDSKESTSPGTLSPPIRSRTTSGTRKKTSA